MHVFSSLEAAPVDPIFGLQAVYASDPRQDKLNATIGTYRTPEGAPYVLPSVVAVEQSLLTEQKSKEYLPIAGDAAYLESTQRLVFGVDRSFEMAKMQTLGGTGALRMAADLLHQVSLHRVSFSIPTWVNHGPIFRRAGIQVASCGTQELLDHIATLGGKDILLMQASCHNPTGMDPTSEMWDAILEGASRQGFFVIFDLAYQGFGDGLEEDVYPIRRFAQAGLSFAVAVSHSKNFGLYRDRVGALYIVCDGRKTREVVESQMKVIARTTYSNPPGFGAQVVARILSDPARHVQWEAEVTAMRRRLCQLRQQLVDGLRGYWPEDKVDMLAYQKGMFAFPQLSPTVVDVLRDVEGIYLAADSRINLGSLNSTLMARMVEALRGL